MAFWRDTGDVSATTRCRRQRTLALDRNQRLRERAKDVDSPLHNEVVEPYYYQRETQEYDKDCFTPFVLRYFATVPPAISEQGETS